MTVRHDGGVLLELLADWYTILAVAESRVDEGERTTDILIGRAAVERWGAAQRSLRDGTMREQAEQSDLYNWHMNLAKGGVVGARRPQGA